MSYLKNINTTGAVGKTPSRVLRAILDEIAGFSSGRILELGAGRGEITEQLLQLPGFDPAKFTALELNPDFCQLLAEKRPELNIRNANAVDFPQFIDEKQDLIISSIPISFLPPPSQLSLLHGIQQHLNPGGKAIILFHAVWLIPTIRRRLSGARIRFFWHLPPYFLSLYQKPIV